MLTFNLQHNSWSNQVKYLLPVAPIGPIAGAGDSVAFGAVAFGAATAGGAAVNVGAAKNTEQQHKNTG